MVTAGPTEAQGPAVADASHDGLRPGEELAAPGGEQPTIPGPGAARATASLKTANRVPPALVGAVVAWNCWSLRVDHRRCPHTSTTPPCTSRWCVMPPRRWRRKAAPHTLVPVPEPGFTAVPALPKPGRGADRVGGHRHGARPGVPLVALSHGEPLADCHLPFREAFWHLPGSSRGGCRALTFCSQCHGHRL